MMIYFSDKQTDKDYIKSGDCLERELAYKYQASATENMILSFF